MQERGSPGVQIPEFQDKINPILIEPFIGTFEAKNRPSFYSLGSSN